MCSLSNVIPTCSFQVCAVFYTYLSLSLSLSLSCLALVEVMFGQPLYAFTEDGVMGTIQVVTSAPAPFDFSFSVNGGELLCAPEEFCCAGIIGITGEPLPSDPNVNFVCLCVHLCVCHGPARYSLLNNYDLNLLDSAHSMSKSRSRAILCRIGNDSEEHCK